jgi:vacuolar-type H+-ATPase subunit E/Vma4
MAVDERQALDALARLAAGVQAEDEAVRKTRAEAKRQFEAALNSAQQARKSEAERREQCRRSRAAAEARLSSLLTQRVEDEMDSRQLQEQTRLADSQAYALSRRVAALAQQLAAPLLVFLPSHDASLADGMSNLSSMTDESENVEFRAAAPSPGGSAVAAGPRLAGRRLPRPAIERIFSFLSLRDLSRCEACCRTWHKVLLPLMREAMVVFVRTDSPALARAAACRHIGVETRSRGRPAP